MTGGGRKPPGSPQLYVLSSNPKKAAKHQDFEETAVKCKIFPCLSPDSSYRAFAVAARACKEKIGGGRTAHAERKQIKSWGQLEECFGVEDSFFYWFSSCRFFLEGLEKCWEFSAGACCCWIFHQQRICLELCGVLGSQWEILAVPRRTGWLRTPRAEELNPKVASTLYLQPQLPQIQGAAGK